MRKFFYIALLPFLLVGCDGFLRRSTIKSELSQANYKMTVDIDAEAEKVLDVMNCPITPQIESDVKVPKIYKTNNLRRRTGYGEFAMGQFIRISGIVTDNFCIPVKNATVQIWHADANGRYKSPPSDGYLNDSMMYREQQERFEESIGSEAADENFSGSGSAITDNLGRFTFFSVMPGGIKPLVNFRIIHKDFNNTKTVMYFNGFAGINPLLIGKKSGQVQYDEVKEYLYEYNITLNGSNKYTGY